jgi:1,2-phenylacetyl-CoA epoxidase catalytic subunit
MSYDEHIAGKKHAHRLKINAILPEAERAFNDLDRMNRWLVLFGKQPATSKKNARKALKRLYVNIFDLLELKDDATVDDAKKIKHKSVSALARYSYEQDKVFPLKIAAKTKKNGGLRAFLQELQITSNH